MKSIIKITDLSDSRLDVFVRLTGAQLRRKLEPEKGVFIAESPTVIEVAIGAKCRPVSLLTDERLLYGANCEIIEKLHESYPDMPVYTASRDTLREIVGFELTRGALCAMHRPSPKTAEEVTKGAKRIAVLEGITDSTNIGAIFRSAAALGIDAVLTTPTCCDPLCRRALRVSMGTVLQIPFAEIGKDPDDWLENGTSLLAKLGFKTAAMALSNDSVSIDDETLLKEERLAIILGTEGDGLAKKTIAGCDYTVKIPMSHGVDSLNVGAAAAVAFWQLRK